MRAKKVDANHSIIKRAFIDAGCSVADTSMVGDGFPDLVVGKNVRTALVEVKADKKSKHTDLQLKFMSDWRGGMLVTVRDLEGVATVVGILESA